MSEPRIAKDRLLRMCARLTETLRAKKEQLIAVKLEEYYQDAKNILIKNRTFLDKVIDGLMKLDTLTQKDIKRIRAEVGY